MSTDTTEAPEGTEEGGEEKAGLAWLPDADTDTIEYLSSRGWDKDPGKLISSQREAEAALRREQQARASMEEELAEAREAAQSSSQQHAQQGDDPFGIIAAAEAYENGDISMAQFAQYQQAATLQAAHQIAEELVGQRVDPLQNRQHVKDLEATAAEIKANYPDFAELSDEVLALMERNPAKYSDPEGMWAAYGLVKSRKQVAEAREARAGSDMETLDSGSRGKQYQDAADALRKELGKMGAPSGGL